MGYVEKSLTPGEEIVYKAKLHWIIYVPAIFYASIAVICFFGRYLPGVTNPIVFDIFAGLFGIIALYHFLYAFKDAITTELAITTKKIVSKTGLLWRETSEQQIAMVDTINVHQTVLGRILGYGTITIQGAGMARTMFKNISQPLTFRQMVGKMTGKSTQSMVTV
jgi:uncharacterized membrane protein YdbT with pleckstrin-like domain